MNMEICRICMNSTGNGPLVGIFDEPDEALEPTLAEMITECTNCKINKQDSLPQNVCLSCFVSAQFAFRFKRRCELSHQLLEQQQTDATYNNNDQLATVLNKKEKSFHEDERNRQNSDLNDDSKGAGADRSRRGSVVCPVCNKRFEKQFRLNRHMISHKTSKPYHCQLCSNSYKQKDSLKRHMRHNHENVDSLD
ncbi:uncharacterized zinc finger protein CG2678-like [Drosophila willistoni]|uniref:uncharacterized zinc finger protein CG2678-like n=1 Tax=Drosophila willistoni TaxID=7260 RepID=UPI000C26D384|nr:uncharacterized zinc finger protein CG2678-like [Drosophila willistoni]